MQLSRPAPEPQQLLTTRLPAACVAYLMGRGVAVDELVARHGLPETLLADPATPIALPRLYGFLADAERVSGDSFLGLHVAQCLPKGACSILEYACRSSATFGASLSSMAQCMSLLSDVIRVTADLGGPVAVLEQRIAGADLCMGRHGNEFFVAANVILSRQLTQQPLSPRRVWLAHPRPADISELEALLGTRDITFDAGANGLEFDAASAALPVVSADAALLEMMRQLARTEGAGRTESRPFLATLRRHLRDRMVPEVPSVSEAASLVQLSPRTFQRRLSEEGTTYKKVVDGLRQELARIYLEKPQLPVGEVAFLLGYSELSGFVRAFRRWTGTTPSAFRAQSATATATA